MKMALGKWQKKNGDTSGKTRFDGARNGDAGENGGDVGAN